MVANNRINRPLPLAIATGGTNTSSLANSNGIGYYDGSSFVTTTAGTASQAMTSGGSGVAPSYSNRSMILVATRSGSAVTWSWTTLLSGVTKYILVISSLRPNDDAATLNMEFSTDGGVSWLNTNYESGILVNSYNTATQVNTNSTSQIRLSAGLDNGVTTSLYTGTIFLYNLNKASYTYTSGTFAQFRNTGGIIAFGNCGGRNTTSTINAIRLILSSGDIAGGSASLYGITE